VKYNVKNSPPRPIIKAGRVYQETGGAIGEPRLTAAPAGRVFFCFSTSPRIIPPAPAGISFPAGVFYRGKGTGGGETGRRPAEGGPGGTGGLCCRRASG